MKLLEGIKIVSLETHVAVPAATRQLADWGAEVIKIEGLHGDLWRNISKTYMLPAEDDENSFFTLPNSNKKLISLDLKEEKAREILFKLLEDADAFISSVRYKSLESMGLDWESLHAKYPKLFYYHFTGYGYEGPKSELPGFDSAAFWANSGLSGDFASDGDTPINVNMAGGDIAAASNVLSGILGGILHSRLTGEGVRGTTSLYASGIWINWGNIIAFQEGYRRMPMKSPKNPYELRGVPFQRVYKCKDGKWLAMCVLEADKGCRVVLPLLGLEDEVNNPKFYDAKQLYANKKEVLDKMTNAFLQKTRDEWIKIFGDADIVVAPNLTGGEIAEDEQAIANDYVSELTFPTGSKMMMPNPPNHFYGVDILPTKSAGAIGSDTLEILKAHGYSDEEITELDSANIIKVAK